MTALAARVMNPNPNPRSRLDWEDSPSKRRPRRCSTAVRQIDGYARTAHVAPLQVTTSCPEEQQSPAAQPELDFPLRDLLALPDATGIRDQATGAETTEVMLDPGVGTPTRTLKHATRADGAQEEGGYHSNLGSRCTGALFSRGEKGEIESPHERRGPPYLIAANPAQLCSGDKKTTRNI